MAICTGGAPSMIGCIKGFASIAEKQYPYIVRTHGFLHREVLVSKIEQYKLKEAMNQVIEMVNFYENSALEVKNF